MACALIQEVQVIETQTRVVRTDRGFYRVQSRIVGGSGEWVNVSPLKLRREEAEAFRDSM